MASGALAQDFEKKKAEPKTPHFLSLNQDIVAWSQDEKCRLKYVIHILMGPVWYSDHYTYTKHSDDPGMILIRQESEGFVFLPWYYWY